MGGVMGGGGSQTTTSQSTTAPWGPMQPYLLDVAGQAQNLYNQGIPQMYTGQYLAPLSSQTQQGMAGITNLANQSQPLIQQGQSEMSNLATGAGLGGGNQYLTNLLTGAGPLGSYITGLGGTLTGNQAQNTAQGLLSSIAGGSQVMNNPYLQQAYQQASQPIIQQFENTIQPGIEAEFSAAGRYGGAHPGQAQATTQDMANTALGNSLASLSSGIYNNAYNQGLQQQTQALQALANLGTTQTGQQLQLGQLLGNIGVSGAQALNQGQLGQGQLQYSAAGALPGMAQAAYQPFSNLMNVGSALDQYNNQNQLYQEQLFNYLNGGGQWQTLGNYANIIAGDPASKATQTSGTTTQQAPTQSMFGQILGGATGLGSMIAGAPQIGAGVNYLRGLF